MSGGWSYPFTFRKPVERVNPSCLSCTEAHPSSTTARANSSATRSALNRRGLLVLHETREGLHLQRSKQPFLLRELSSPLPIPLETGFQLLFRDRCQAAAVRVTNPNHGTQGPVASDKAVTHQLCRNEFSEVGSPGRQTHRSAKRERDTPSWLFDSLLWGIASRFLLANHLALPGSESMFSVSQGPSVCAHTSQPRRTPAERPGSRLPSLTTRCRSLPS